jgi:hypothetical protein
MSRRASLDGKAMRAIDKRGALLVYPLNNRREPLSIWSELYPRSKMRWDWDQDGDNRVADLWSLRMRLSISRHVIYAKWFQGRATFFSREVFIHLLAYLGSVRVDVPPNSASVLELLRNDSPLSTKQLKAAAELEGRALEPTYNRAMKPLWAQLLIVGFGEFEDSSFPSLGIGAAATLFEDEWNESELVKADVAAAFLCEKLGSENPFFKYARKVRTLATPSLMPRSP